MELTEVLKKRRSYRAYQKKAVSRDTLKELMHAAQQAPVSCNLELTQYIIVDDPVLLAQLDKEASYKFSYTPTCIVVCYDPRFTVEHHSAVMTAGMQVENILLRATELGLAAIPMAGFSKDNRIKQALKIPAQLELLLLVAVGYAESGVPRPVTKVAPDALFAFNSYKGLTILNEPRNLKYYTPKQVIEYRSRIAPVYLERFRLRTYATQYYEAVAEHFAAYIKNRSLNHVLDLMSYDGMFIRLLHKKNPALSIVASDYIENNLSFFKETLAIEPILILEDNTFEKPITCNILSFVFQAEFTPNLPALLVSAHKSLSAEGRFYLASVYERWYRRIFKQLRDVLRLLRGKKINVYEGNAFYRVGPWKHLSRRAIKNLMKNAGFILEEEGAVLSGAVHGVEVRFQVWKKVF